MKKIFSFFATLTMVMSMFAATETVYFVNADKWTGTINAYAWTSSSNASWPGTAATKEAEQLAGCDVYSYSAEAGTYANVIFNNGSKQTADLTWTAGKYYVRDGWYTKEEALIKLGQPVEYESVYFVNVDGWSSVKIYTWTPEVGTWPGVDMKKETETIGGKEVWSHTEMKGASFGGVIFNNGSGTQTTDLKWTAGKYYVTDGWYTKEEAEAKLSGNTPVDPKPQGAYYITGNDALFGANAWKSDAIAMTEAEGVYTHTFTAVAAGVECQLKVTDGTWNNSWGFSNLTTVPTGVTGNNDNNIIFTLAEAGDVAVSFSAEKITITGNFAGSSVDPAQITYVLMGVQGDWTTGIKLTKNETVEWEEYMLLGQTISEGDSVKVVRLENGAAKHWCGNVKDGCKELVLENTVNDNIVLAPGAYDFYYDVAADAIWIAVSSSNPSALDNVAIEKKATKVIRNGQMYILRDGVLYNAIGQIVE